MKKFISAIGLVIATLIWGSAFAAQRSAMQYVTPAVFTTLRSAAGVLALVPIVILFDLVTLRRVSFWGNAATFKERCHLLAGGLICGLIITLAFIAQQMGLRETSAGKSGFLTALYIIIVPVIGIFLKRRTSPVLWFSVLLALVGSFLLCYRPGSMSLSSGDTMVIICAVLFSCHILAVDYFAADTDSIRLSLLQFATAAFFAAFLSLTTGGGPDDWTLDLVRVTAPHWVYCGIGSCAIAFTIQIAAQKYLHPVVASLLMSLESVFAVIAGWLFLHEKLRPIELTGCILLFVAVLAAQIPAAGKKETR